MTEAEQKQIDRYEYLYRTGRSQQLAEEFCHEGYGYDEETRKHFICSHEAGSVDALGEHIIKLVRDGWLGC